MFLSCPFVSDAVLVFPIIWQKAGFYSVLFWFALSVRLLVAGLGCLGCLFVSLYLPCTALFHPLASVCISIVPLLLCTALFGLYLGCWVVCWFSALSNMGHLRLFLLPFLYYLLWPRYRHMTILLLLLNISLQHLPYCVRTVSSKNLLKIRSDTIVCHRTVSHYEVIRVFLAISVITSSVTFSSKQA